MKQKQKFSCTQSELYAVCSHAWENCSAKLPRFTAFKKMYSAEFIKSRQAEVDKAMEMQDQSQRASLHERKRLALKEQVQQCMVTWKKLRSYIRAAWEEEESETCIRNAGLAHYQETYKMKWESCLSLMTNGETFIKDNSVKLLAGNNMDPDFPAEFNAVKTAFSDMFKSYLNSSRENELLTAEKLAANNKLYTDMMNMFSDARMIFRKEPELLKQFVFDSVLLQVSGRSSSGIKGRVSNGQLGSSEIEGLLLSLLENGDSISVDEDGNYRFSQVAAGVYTMQVSAPGYREQTIPGLEVRLGSYTIQNIVLVKEAGPAA